MSRIAATFDPTANGGAGAFDTTFGIQLGQMVIINESASGLLFEAQDGSQKFVPATSARLWQLSRPSTRVAWSTLISPVTNTISNPMVIVEAYDPGEPIVETYPASFTRQTNVGNTVPTTPTGSQLTTNLAGTTFEAKATASVTLLDGTNGTLIELYETETNGQVTTPQLDYIDGTGATHPGPQVRTTSTAYAYPGQLIDPNSNNYVVGSTFQGATTGTYNHNFRGGKIPDFVNITTNVNGSQTVGVDSLGTTTVHVTCGAGYPFYGSAGLC